MNLAILGCGKIGEAVLGGLLASRTVQPADLTVTVRRSEHADILRERHGVQATTDNAAAIRSSATVLLCVKPQKAKQLLPDLADDLAGRLVISTVAGVDLARLQGWLPDSRIIRSMPNTPCLIREGMTVLSPGTSVTDDDLDVGRSIFASVGRCLVLEERHMNAVTGLSGSGIVPTRSPFASNEMLPDSPPSKLLEAMASRSSVGLMTSESPRTTTTAATASSRIVAASA